MSASSVADFVVPSSETTPATSNDTNPTLSIEVPDPPAPPSSIKKRATSESDSYTTESENDVEDADDDDDDLPIDLTFDWLEEQMRAGIDLRPLLSRILPGLPEDVSQSTIYEILMDLFLPHRQRKPLEQYRTFDDAVELIRTSKNILVLTGAGISVSCGIPDFRSRNGVYARLREEFPELPNPQSMFDIQYFTDDPRPFFRFAKEIWPGQYEPSLSHYFIAELERREQLLRNYTQNIDSLEHLCPIQRLIQCHGSFSTATCRVCQHSVRSEEIKDEILQQKIPYCPKCPANTPEAILKPDIVFFGEALSDEFHKTISSDREKCDLLIVMGSSLKVKPVSLVSELLPENVPQILINRERLPHKTFDIELLGNCDLIVRELCLRLAQSDASFGQIKHITHQPLLSEILYDNLHPTTQPQERKKRKLSPSIEESTPAPLSSGDHPVESLEATADPSPSVSTARRTFSSLVPSSAFNPDTSYISYPPRRYVFAGAEMCFYSDDESSDDDDDDGDDEEEEEEELSRKNAQ